MEQSLSDVYETFVDALANDPRLRITLGLAALYILYSVLLVVYRLTLDPLAKIPGPKIAAATAFYAFYWDVLRSGKYAWRIKEMHEKYGPIVRIRPNTVHIQDAKFMDQVYGSTTNRRDKSQIGQNFLMIPTTVIGTGPHELHRKRRQPLAPYFSKQSIRRLEPVVIDTLRKTLDVFDIKAKSGQPFEVKSILDAATCDIITEYSYGNAWGCLEKEDLNLPFFDLIYSATRFTHANSYIPLVSILLKSLPESVLGIFLPRVRRLAGIKSMMLKEIARVRKNKAEESGKVTVLENLIFNDLPAVERSDDQVWLSALLLVTAGTETTTRTMTNTIFRVLSNPEVYKKLRAELVEALPDPNMIPTVAQVENLPYLKAVITETLRHDPPVWTRQERVAPNDDLEFTDERTGKKYMLPRGTNMGMTAPLLQHDPNLYENPEEYNPDRYFQDQHLDRFLLTFSHGPRICLGMNLSWSEMPLFLACIFRRYEMKELSSKGAKTIELYKTSEEDVTVVEEFASPFYAKGTHGVRIILKNSEKA